MNFSKFLKTWHGTQDENRFLRRANIVQMALNLLLLVALLAKGHTVVMVPPGLSESGSVSASSASVEVRSSWALYYATLIGNVTPANVAFLSQQLSTSLTPRLYHEVNDALTEQVNQVRNEQITTRFSPAQTRVDPRTGHVFVTGQLTTEGVRGNSEKETRTYEFGFIVSNYRVLLDTMSIHKGEVGPADRPESSS